MLCVYIYALVTVLCFIYFLLYTCRLNNFSVNRVAYCKYKVYVLDRFLTVNVDSPYYAAYKQHKHSTV